PVLGEANPLCLAKPLHNPVPEPLVDVVATKVLVTIGGFNLHHALSSLQNGNVEGSAAEIVDCDGLIFLLVQPIGQCRRRWLVDDALDFEPRDSPRVLGRLTLAIIEVSRNSYHRLANLLA